MGRRSTINDIDIQKQEHLVLLDDEERTVVEMRWGLVTGEKMTQREAAERLQIKLEELRRKEMRAAQKIKHHLDRSQSLATEATTNLERRVAELEEIVSAMDLLFPYLKMRRKPRKMK